MDPLSEQLPCGYTVPKVTEIIPTCGPCGYDHILKDGEQRRLPWEGLLLRTPALKDSGPGLLSLNVVETGFPSESRDF